MAAFLLKNWLAALYLNVDQLNLVQQNKPREEILARHAAVFSEELGCLKIFHAIQR